MPSLQRYHDVEFGLDKLGYVCQECDPVKAMKHQALMSSVSNIRSSTGCRTRYGRDTEETFRSQ
jgi:hypothetical protein